MKKVVITVFLIITLSIAANIFGLLWLTVAILVLGLLLLFSMLGKKMAERLPVRRMRRLMWLLTMVIIPTVLLRLFVFEVFNIPSSSMENTLVPGDKIVVNKLLYGPSLPRSPLDIPWFNAFFLLNREAKAKELEWKYRRMPGIGKIERGDVVVFRYPVSPFQNFVKRCVALPGDTVEVAGGVLYVNGTQQKFPVSAKIEYRLHVRDRKGFNDLRQKLGLDLPYAAYNDSLHYCTVCLTANELKKVKKAGSVDSFTVKVLNGSQTVPSPGYAEWSPDNYGPFVVPYKGMKVHLDERAFAFFETVLLKYEHFDPRTPGTGIDTTVTFSQDYYFMMGDNRHNSTDSRYWGVVPEELITGKAVKILWSGKFTNLKPGRFWKSIE